MNNERSPEISFVIPVFNEEDALASVFESLLPIAASLRSVTEIVVVNDGSSDNSLVRLLDLKAVVPELVIVDLSRNFGKEAALTAGLSACKGKCAIMLDADLQDPPELIPIMVERWREGHEMVVAVHSGRESDSFLRRVATQLFYKVMNAVSDTLLIPDAGDFRLLDRAVIDAFLNLPERTRFNKGLFAWLGFRQSFIEHMRPKRYDGNSKYSFRRLGKLAMEGLTSFSWFPLRLFSFVGVIVALSSVAYGAYIAIRTMLLGVDMPGYASVFVAITFLGGLNLVGIGVLGEYLGRVFQEVKRRPLFIVRRMYESNAISQSNKK